MNLNDENFEQKIAEVIISKTRNLQLDGLRSIAFLCVFFHHSLHIPLLWFGVDLFFVLSGFLITGILFRNTSPHNLFISFYYKRFLRIFPPYFLVLGLVFFLLSTDWHKYWYWYVFFFSNVQQVFGYLGHPDLVPTWSLAVEEQFYVLWPLLIYLFGRKGMWWLSIALLFMAPLFRGILGILFQKHWAVYMLLPCRVDLLASGALLAMLLHKSKTNFIAFSNKGLIISVIATCCFGLLTLCIPSFRTGANFLLFNIFGYSLISIFMVGIVAYFIPIRSCIIARLLRSKILVFLGTISYMMYLIHLIILNMVVKLGFSALFTSVLSLVIVVVISSLSWYYLESPIQRLKNKFSK